MASGRVRVEFRVFAPDAREVELAGSFNNWSKGSDLMKRDKAGTWKKVKLLPQGAHEYKYIVDGIWTLDPNNPHTVFNQYGTKNNVIEARKTAAGSESSRKPG